MKELNRAALNQIYAQDLNELASECYRIAADHGFHDLDDIPDTNVYKFNTRLLLIVAEAVEAMEEMRADENMDGIKDELADIIIRVLYLAHTYDLNIGHAVVDKMEYNRTRPYKHGKQF